MENHLQKLKDDDDGVADENDAAAWEGWDVDSDSPSSDESEGWMDVPDNDEDLIISDSEDEQDKAAPETGISDVPSRTSTLATAKASEANVFSST